MVAFKLVFTKQAQNGAKQIVRSNLKEKAVGLLKIFKEDPFKKPPA